MSAPQFYVATDFARKEEAREVADALMVATPLQLRARWLTDQPVLLEGGLGGELYDDQAEAACRVAVEDLEDIWHSQVFVQLTSGEKARGGRHVELGYALGQAIDRPHRQIIALGPREHAFHYHPLVVHAPTVEDLVHWAKGYCAGARI